MEIKLTNAGDTLISFDRVNNPRAVELKSGGQLNKIQGELLGWHSCSVGYFHMVLHGLSKTHNVIVCRGCHLRIVIPKTVKTYADLEVFLRKERG